MMEILQPLLQGLQGFRRPDRPDYVSGWRRFFIRKKKVTAPVVDRRRLGGQAAAEAELAVGTSEIVFRTCEAIW